MTAIYVQRGVNTEWTTDEAHLKQWCLEMWDYLRVFPEIQLLELSKSFVIFLLQYICRGAHTPKTPGGAEANDPWAGIDPLQLLLGLLTLTCAQFEVVARDPMPNLIGDNHEIDLIRFAGVQPDWGRQGPRKGNNSCVYIKVCGAYHLEREQEQAPVRERVCVKVFVRV